MATLAGQKTTSLSEISQTIDLSEFLGRRPTATEKQRFADLAIEKINQRTLDGQDLDGNSFARYSEEYAAKKGVSVDSVDLFLEGDMLDSIGRRKSKERTSTVFLQMKKGLQTKKAFNHDTGDTLPKREFFGLTRDEASSIAESIKEEAPARTTLSDLAAAIEAIDTLDIGVGFGDS